MTDKYDYFKNQVDMFKDDIRDAFQTINRSHASLQAVIENIKLSPDLTQIEKIGLAAYAVNEIGKVINNDLHNR